ncbi:Spherulation-specific family 4-domain-containing protein [Aspergillus coremiiformis]|uniref:Spherulation-specific family 4-domain-containing protein n=1 Tax=Aspergillus coremiiformis TaxID=138285 RepID=A0A5N6YXS6_9EURO|nr:Spherulation-specific family 4-domain-containing protein [Aspergillus coremiiformis]
MTTNWNNTRYSVLRSLCTYTTNGVPTPILTGSTIEVTSVGDLAENGLLVYLSPDIKTSLKSTMDSNCVIKVDTGCYQAVMDLLEGANHVLQSRSLEQRALEQRNPAALIYWAGGILIFAILFPLVYKGDHVVPVPIKIPPNHVEDSLQLETATAIVVDKATGSPAVIMIFASAGNSISVGDVGIELDPVVAVYLQALLSGSDNRNCVVGEDFPNSIHVHQLELTNVICGAEIILVDAIGRAGAPDWLYVHRGRMPWTRPEMVVAVNTVVRWVLNQATLLNPTISGAHLDDLVVGAVALSWAFFNNGAITTNNVIPLASLRGGPSATVYAQQTVPMFTTTLTTTKTASGPSPTEDSSGGKGQQVVVASYINPLADPAAWDRLIRYPVKKMPILVTNIVNGLDSAVNKTWAGVIDRASAFGKTVLGYVRTGYLGVSDQKFTTWLGSGNLVDWTASSIGDIFFDEGWPECSDNNEYVDLYKYINNYTKRAHPGAYTILNPGSPIMSCFEDTMDTLLTFELSYKVYINSYIPNDWTPKDLWKLWHIVYNVPESMVDEITKLVKKRGAGFLQLTDNTLPNSYNTLPVVVVSGLSVSALDYTSAKLSWNTALNVLGHDVYSGNRASHAFHISTVGGGGCIGSVSNTVTVDTKSLLNRNTITNYHSFPGADLTTIQADILVPYAFIRLYIWNLVGCEFDTHPGWSVNFKIDEYVCTHYMVEGTMLYKYSGTLPEGSTAPPWAWLVIQGYNPLTNVFEPDPSVYDCKGLSMCMIPDFLKWCDHAVNTLYNETGINQSGNCWGDQTRSCGVFIQGNASCSISSNALWNDYQNI